MFPFPKNDKRQYTCFVCGVAFKEFKSFNDHILETHDEGREYVKCPLQRCGACVRDLRQHFKSKHINEKLPKTGQLRASIWKDQDKKTGKMSQKTKFREGYMYSVKNGKEVHYRSGMECEVYECLEAMSEVIGYEVEPFKLNYSFQGKVHEYNPDLQIFFGDGRTEIWEVKPSNQTSLPKNAAKWASCQYFCESRGYNFMVVTEVGLQKLKKGIKI